MILWKMVFLYLMVMNLRESIKMILRENLVVKFANNLRLEENKDLPSSNQMGLKTSNLFGEIIFDPSEFFNTKYNFSKKKSDDFTYESIITTLILKILLHHLII